MSELDPSVAAFLRDAKNDLTPSQDDQSRVAQKINAAIAVGGGTAIALQAGASKAAWLPFASKLMVGVVVVSGAAAFTYKNVSISRDAPASVHARTASHVSAEPHAPVIASATTEALPVGLDAPASPVPLEPPRAAVRRIARATDDSQAVVAVAPTSAPAPVPEVVPAPDPATPSATPSVTAEDALARETGLIQEARRAIESAQHEHAMQLLDVYLATPGAHMLAREERVLRVRALCGLHLVQEAQAIASRLAASSGLASRALAGTCVDLAAQH